MIQEYVMLIGRRTERGCYDSRNDFPQKPNVTPRHPFENCTDIILRFINKTFMIPGNLLHYIDDVDSIGCSWVPPVDFINCLETGRDPDYDGDKDTIHPIGYLFKKSQDNRIYDSYYGNDDQNPKLAQTSPSKVIDKDVLALLERIHTYVEESDELHKDSREEFSSIQKRRLSIGKK